MNPSTSLLPNSTAVAIEPAIVGTVGAEASTASRDALTPIAGGAIALVDEPITKAVASEGTFTTPDLQPQAIEETSTQPSKEAAVQSVNFVYMQKLGITDWSYAALQLLHIEVGKALPVRQEAELKGLAEDFAKMAAELGVSDRALIWRLKSMSSNKDMKRDGMKKEASKPMSHDSKGNGPKEGKTYEHPETKNRWTKKRAQGSAPKEFVECIQAGALWADLEVEVTD